MFPYHTNSLRHRHLCQKIKHYRHRKRRSRHLYPMHHHPTSTTAYCPVNQRQPTFSASRNPHPATRKQSRRGVRRRAKNRGIREITRLESTRSFQRQHLKTILRGIKEFIEEVKTLSNPENGRDDEAIEKFVKRQYEAKNSTIKP